MKTLTSNSPYIRKEVNTSRMMLDVFIALIPVSVFAVYRFGFDALSRITLSMIVMVLLEGLAFGLINKKYIEGSFTQKIKAAYKTYRINNIIIPALSGLIFALIIPSKLPLYGVIIGASFGIVFAKMLFGGTGQNIFNIAAAGRIFVGLAYTKGFTNAYTSIDLTTGSTALSTVRSLSGVENVFNYYGLRDLFLGNIPGSMGEISALLIILGGAYLLIRKSADIRLIIGSLIPFMILMFVAGLSISIETAIPFMLFQLFSGGILFGIVYMITDPVTAPLSTPGRLLYSLLFVSFVVLIRLFGAYPEGVAFAILFANMFSSLIDYPGLLPKKKMTYNVMYASILVTMSLIVFFGFGGY